MQSCVLSFSRKQWYDESNSMQNGEQVSECMELSWEIKYKLSTALNETNLHVNAFEPPSRKISVFIHRPQHTDMKSLFSSTICFQALSVYKTCNFCWWPYKLWCLSFCWVFFVQPTRDVFNVHVHVRNVLVCRLQIKANVNWNLHLQSTHASFGAVGCLSSTAASIYLHCSRKLFLSTQNSCCHSVFVLSLLSKLAIHIFHYFYRTFLYHHRHHRLLRSTKTT